MVTHLDALRFVGGSADPHIHRCDGVQQHHIVPAKIALVEVTHRDDHELPARGRHLSVEGITQRGKSRAACVKNLLRCLTDTGRQVSPVEQDSCEYFKR